MYNNSGINKVFLLGHIESSPRLHKTGKAENICFTLKTVERIQKNSEPVEHVELHNLIVDKDLADIQNIEIKKNDLLHIVGKIQTKMWVDEENIKRYKTEIVVTQLTPVVNQVIETY